MSQPVLAQLRCVGYCAPVDLNRPAQGPQLQLIADPNSTSLDESLRKRDLKLAGHLRHHADHHTNQGYGQGFRLDSLAVRTTRGKRSRRGRAEMIVGRGSSIEAFPLFGFRLEDYDALFAEKLDLLLHIRTHEHVHWSGQYRPALTGQGVYPRPVQNPLPIWLGVGGTPQSFVRAGQLGLPLMVAIIGGEPRRFRPLIDLYRQTGMQHGHSAEQLKVGVHMLGYVADTTQEATDTFFPGYAKAMTDVGKERGWPAMTRASFDVQRGRDGALLIGSPDEVVDKILRHAEALGGISRISFQMNVASLPQVKRMRAIDAIGARIVPALHQA